MKRTKGFIPAVVAVGAGLSSSSAYTSDFNVDLCLKRAAGGLNYDLTVGCPVLRPAILQWHCITRAYTWYGVEVASCIAMDANADQRPRKPLI